MLFSSPIVSQASGSLAGLTFSHTRGSKYIKARTTPTNPNSQRQAIVRAAMGVLGPVWGQTLTQLQRDGWRLYASNVPSTNKIGETIHLTGQQHFTRINIPRIQIGEAILEDAPTIFDLGTFTAPTIDSILSSSQIILIAFDNTDDWAIADDGFMIVYAGRPTSTGEEFFRGPWRFAGIIEGAVAPPGSPAALPSPWFIAIDEIMWVKIRVMQTDGRLSAELTLGPETVVPV